jgi:FkbM family methyltransferase
VYIQKSHEYVEFNITDESDLSTIVGYGQDDEHSLKRRNGKIVKVPTISLLDMLNEKYAPQIVDYLSIDTEGSEYDILESFFSDNTYYKIRCITVEHNFNIENRQKLFDLLTKKWI